MPSTPVHTLSPAEKDIFYWIVNLIPRFPKSLDARLLKGFHYLLGPGIAPSFIKTRSLPHLKKLLLTQFSFQKKIEGAFALGHELLLVRIFPVGSLICIAIAAPKKAHPLSGQMILEIAGQQVPALKKIDASFFAWDNPTWPYTFCYVELEKMRGKDLLTSEITSLEAHFKREIPYHLAETSTFWPYNHEEAFKELLILAKELTSTTDAPQVSIHFRKQTSNDLEFIVYLARPKSHLSRETTLTNCSLPSSIQLTTHLRKELESDIPLIAEAFSLIIPIKHHKNRSAVNLLHAREFIAKLLEDAIGFFRDYNGGLLELQKKKFNHLSHRLSKKIPHFALFAENIFYGLSPVEAQISLDDAILEKLFEGFSTALATPPSRFKHPNPSTMIITLPTADDLSPLLDQMKNLQEKKKITAYVYLQLASHYYLCLLNPSKNLQENIHFNVDCIYKKKSLRLLFQSGKVPSLNPHYLSDELRSRVLANLLFEGLFRLGPQNKIHYAGCESFHLSKDALRYVFTIRNHSWSNGEKVTASHYEKAWKRNFFLKSGHNFYLLKNADAIRHNKKPLHMLGVQALDDTHLKVTLERPDVHFIEKLTQPLFFPSPQKESETLDFNGPYSVQEKNADKLLLEKNSYYWDKKAIFFDKVSILFERSSKKISELFEQGHIDWIGNPCSYEAPIAKPLRKKNLPYPFFAYLNTQFFPLSSPFIRQAFSRVIDRRLIARSIFPGNNPLFTPLPEPLSQYKSKEPDYDLKQGKKLFEQGLQELGLTKETFPTLKLSFFNIKNRVSLAKYLQEKWQSVFGIKIELDITDWISFYNQVEKGFFHIAGFFEGTFSFLDCIPFFDSFTYREGNFSGWEDATYKELISLLKTSTSKKARSALLAQAEALLLQHMPFIPLTSLVYSYAHVPGLKNYTIDKSGNVDFRFSSYTERNSSVGNVAPASASDILSAK